MKLTIRSAALKVPGHLGPTCISCGNTKTFWVQGAEGERLVEMTELQDGDVRIAACGRCRSRRSIVIAHVD